MLQRTLYNIYYVKVICELKICRSLQNLFLHQIMKVKAIQTNLIKATIHLSSESFQFLFLIPFLPIISQQKWNTSLARVYPSRIRGSISSTFRARQFWISSTCGLPKTECSWCGWCWICWCQLINSWKLDNWECKIKATSIFTRKSNYSRLQIQLHWAWSQQVKR